MVLTEGSAYEIDFACLAGVLLYGRRYVAFRRKRTAPAEKMAGSYNAFGLKLLAQTRQAVPGKNVFLSPAGLAFALSMAADGAEGETLRQMGYFAIERWRRRFERRPTRRWSNICRSLDPKIKLEIANSLWTAEDAAIKAAIPGRHPAILPGRSRQRGFQKPRHGGQNQCLGAANIPMAKFQKWSSRRLDDNRLILLDAIYFKGDWTTPFDKKLTRELPFTLRKRPEPCHTSAHEPERRISILRERRRFRRFHFPMRVGAVSMYVFLAEGRPGRFSAESDRGELAAMDRAASIQKRHGGTAAFQIGKRVRPQSTR